MAAENVPAVVAAPSGPVPAWLLNLLGFQLAWLAVVLTAARGQPWIGTLVVLAFATWHLTRVRPYRSEALLLALAALAGLVFDSLLLGAGWVDFSVGMPVAGLAPYWMVALWINFAMVLNVSLRWLQGRTLWAALLGAVGGPLAYWGGAGLGAMVLLQAGPALLALALGWAVLTPLLLALAGRLARAAAP